MDEASTDPLGRVITLHDRTWFGHIVKGHPEMAEHRARPSHATLFHRGNRMVKPDSIEGTVGAAGRQFWFHYDIGSDVLYLRLESERQTPTFADETTEGLMLRAQDNQRAVGITVVNWWKRFGDGALPDSIQQIGRSIEPWTSRVAA